MLRVPCKWSACPWNIRDLKKNENQRKIIPPSARDVSRVARLRVERWAECSTHHSAHESNIFDSNGCPLKINRARRWGLWIFADFLFFPNRGCSRAAAVLYLVRGNPPVIFLFSCWRSKNGIWLIFIYCSVLQAN